MLLLDRMDKHCEVYPVARADRVDLDAFMFETDSPYERRVTADGGRVVGVGISACEP
jgi:hypothetical protein